MPSTPSERLGIELQARGENVNSWGDTRLNEALKRLEEAVAGVETLVITGDIVLTSAFYVKNQARMGTLVLMGTPAANFRVTIPGVQKTYNVINLTPRVANFGVADMATVPVRAGLSNLVVCDGAVTRVVDLTLDQIRTAAAAINIGGQRITNVAAATADTDGINRGQAISLTFDLVTRAQEWANKTGAVVDVGEYSAKEYAVGTTAPAGSAKDWASLLSAIVAAGEYSAKEYAVGATTPLGSAKRWATATGVVADGLKGGRGYANDSASSAQTSTDQAAVATNRAGAAAGFAQSAADQLADFNNRYVVAAQFPTVGNYPGRLAFATGGNQFGVYDGSIDAFQTIAIPSQATETVTGVVRLASLLESFAGTSEQAVITAARNNLMARKGRTVNEQITRSDRGALIDITAGTFTQQFANPASLGDGFYCYVRNGGSGDVTIPASDGVTDWIMYPGEVRLFQCDGTALRSVVLAPFVRVWSANGQFVRPPGYIGFGAIIIGGGGGGSVRGTGSTSATGGAPAAAYGLNFIPSSAMPQNSAISIGAPGIGATANGNSATVNGGAGGISSIEGFFAAPGGSPGSAADPDLLTQPSLLANDAVAFQSGYGVHLRFGTFSNRFNAAAGPFGFAGGLSLGADGVGAGSGGAARDNSASTPVKAGNGGRGEVRIWGVA